MSLPRYEIEHWWVREWQKVRPEEGVYRFYRLSLQQNLWGEWELTTSWGRIGQKPSRVLLQVLDSPSIAEQFAVRVDRVRLKRGYARQHLDEKLDLMLRAQVGTKFQ